MSTCFEEDNVLFQDFLKNKINTVFQFHSVVEADVSCKIKSLNSKPSYGHYGITSNILKLIELYVVKSLTLIINQSLATGIFPDQLKIAKIIPIFKKGNKYSNENYMPISLLPVISKLFEKIIYDQIYPYFDSNNILSNNQYGLRRLHSTEFAVLEILDRITEALDQGHTPFVFYLDLSKAFDSLNHSILLGKLKYYGLTNFALSLFSSYLSNRKQYVEIDHCKSDIFFSTVGVPQGSILGLLLFVIYLNDLFNSSQFFDLVAYADDITLINTHDLNCCSDMSQLFNAE